MTSTKKRVQAGSAQRRGAKSRLKPIVQGEVAKPVVTSKVAVRKADAAKRQAPTSDKPAARPNSKGAKILSLLQHPGGVTLAAIMKATEWQAHSVRGFLSGTISKRMGLKLTSTRSDAGERVYSVVA